MLAGAHLASPDEAGDPSPTLLSVLGRQTVATSLSDNGAQYSCIQTLTLSRTTTYGVSIKSSNGTAAAVVNTYRLCASASSTSVVIISGVLVPCDLFVGDSAAATDTSAPTPDTTATPGFGTGFGAGFGVGLNFSSGTTFGGASKSDAVAAQAASTLALLLGVVVAALQLF